MACKKENTRNIYAVSLNLIGLNLFVGLHVHRLMLVRFAFSTNSQTAKLSVYHK